MRKASVDLPHVNRPAARAQARDHATVVLVAPGSRLETPWNDEDKGAPHSPILRLSHTTIQSSRVRRPRERLPTRALATETAGLVAVVCVALIARAELALSMWYPIKAAAWFSIVMLFALGLVRRHHPFAQFGAANQLTTARAVVAVLVAGLIGESGPPSVAGTAAAVSILATVLDGLDGWVARRAGMASAFGARFDVEIDALLIQALAILAWQYGKAGAWVLCSGLIRYGFVSAGWMLPWMRQPLAPTLRGRIICVVQTAALVLAIVPPIMPPVSTVIAALGLAAICYSFVVDTLRLWRHAAEVEGV
jgi:phosphatidylglycerophosphate synthase